jgi:hypothetical protein
MATDDSTTPAAAAALPVTTQAAYSPGGLTFYGQPRHARALAELKTS